MFVVFRLDSLTVQDVVRLGNIIKGFALSDLANIPDVGREDFVLRIVDRFFF